MHSVNVELLVFDFNCGSEWKWNEYKALCTYENTDALFIPANML